MAKDFRMILIGYISGHVFGTTKCKVLRIVCNKSVFERDYHLGDKKLERVTVEQDLGIWITQDLSWNTHVEYVTAKAKKKC